MTGISLCTASIIVRPDWRCVRISVMAYFALSLCSLLQSEKINIIHMLLTCAICYIYTLCRYILSSKIENKPDDYVFVYYKGRNDAWDGYGGAVVYTRSAVLPESIVPELQRAAQSVGRDFSKFIRTDNTCGPEPPLVERLEKTVETGEKTIIKEVEEIEGEIEGEVEKVKDTEMTLFKRLAEGFKVLKQDEEYFLRELSKEEMDILSELKMEASEVEKLFGRALPLRKLR